MLYFISGLIAELHWDHAETSIMHSYWALTAPPAAAVPQKLGRTLRIYLVSKCMHRSLSLHIYLRINLAKPADVGAETEAGDEQSSQRQKNITDGCVLLLWFRSCTPACLGNIMPEPSEIRSPGTFQSLFSFCNGGGGDAQTGKQWGCHILHFISRLLNKYTYNKAKIIMDLHLTDSLCLINSEETCSLGHSVIKCHQVLQLSSDLNSTKNTT